MDLSRRDLFRRMLSKSSAQVLRLLAGTDLERLVGISDDSQPSAEQAGLALRRRRRATALLMPSRAGSPPNGSPAGDIVPAAPAEAEPAGSGDHDGRR